MNLPKFPHSAMFVGVTACGKTEFLLQLLETIYKNHFEFIVILCPTILDNKTYLSRKWIFDDKNVFIVCDIEGKLNEWIRLCRYQFHPKPSPPRDKPPGHDSKGAKTLPPGQ